MIDKNLPAIFNFEGSEVRILFDENDNPWWVAKDVCDVLEILNVSDTLKRIPEKYKGVDSIYTLGGKQQMAIISEAALYELIFTSRKEEAQRFKEWVFEQVLPSIRLTGKFEITQKFILDAYIKQLGPWSKMFPNEYYEEIHRLMGWEYDPTKTDRPGYVGKLTNRLIYDCLPPGTLDRLRELNPSEGGGRKHLFHQFLTDEVGKKHLQKQIDWVVEMSKICSNMETLLELAENRRNKTYGTDGQQLKFLKVNYELVGV